MAPERPPKVHIHDNRGEERYELRLDGELAGVLEYERGGDRITLIHTETVAALEGRGIGSALVVAALDEAREAKLTVVPRCPFVREFIGRNPAYLHIVTPEYRERIARDAPP